MSNRHRLYGGASGSGKDVSAIHDLLDEVVGQSFLHYTDGRGDNALYFLECLWGRYQHVLWDDLTQTRNVLPL